MMKKKFLISFQRSILFFIPLFLTSCAGGSITMNASDGSKIKFKKENVSCEKSAPYKDWFGGTSQNVDCTANGVRTFLTGDRTNFSDTQFCAVFNLQGVRQDPPSETDNSFACSAASKFGKLKLTSSAKKINKKTPNLSLKAGWKRTKEPDELKKLRITLMTKIVF